MVQAFVLAAELKLDKITVEGDSLGAVFALCGVEDYADWRSKQKQEQGHTFLKNHPLWSISFANRSCNKSAHSLAQWARRTNFVGNLDLTNLPEIIFCDSRDTSVTILDEVNIDG